MQCYPDPDTGYYDPDEYFDYLDAQHEEAEEKKELEELESEEEQLETERALITARREMKDPTEDVDPETGCAFAEMSGGRMIPPSWVGVNENADSTLINLKKGRAA